MKNEEIKNSFEENIISLEDIQKIKIIKIYDYVKDNREKIETSNFSLTPIAKSFNLSRFELVSYLKNVCDLSQTLGTDEVCTTLYAVKEQLETESKKKNPSISEIRIKEVLNDDRFHLVTINSPKKVVIPDTHNLYEQETEELGEDKRTSIYEPIEDKEINSFYEEESSSIFETIESSQEQPLIPFVSPNIELEELIEDEDSYQRKISEELIINDVEYKEEGNSLNLNNSENKKSSTKNKLLIIGGGSLGIISLLFGSFVMLNNSSSGMSNQFSQNNIEQQVVLPKDILTSHDVIVPMEAIQEKLSVKVPIQSSDVYQEEQITPYTEERREELPLHTENKKEIRLDEMEQKLNLIIQALAEKKDTTSVSNPYLSSKKERVETIETNPQEEVSLSFSTLSEAKSAVKGFLIKEDKSIEYKNVIYKEGDILGNIQIERIVPKAYIKFRDMTSKDSKSISLRK